MTKTKILMKLLLLFVIAYSCSSENRTSSDHDLDSVKVITGYHEIWKNGFVEYYLGKFDDDSLIVRFEKEDQMIGDGYTLMDKVYETPKIYLGNNLVYNELNRENNYSMKAGNSVILGFKTTKYVLLRRIDPLDNDMFLVIQVHRNGVSLYEAYANMNDIDNDARMEVGGFSLSEAPCSDCDSAYYRSAKYYELADKFEYDSVASRLATERKFGVYLKNPAKDTVLYYKR